MTIARSITPTETASAATLLPLHTDARAVAAPHTRAYASKSASRIKIPCPIVMGRLLPKDSPLAEQVTIKQKDGAQAAVSAPEPQTEG